MSPRTFVARSAAILSLAALGLAACESKTIVQPANNPLTIVVSPAAVTLTAAGQKAQFVAVVSGGQDTQAKTYSWASSNTAVATVDANGIVTAVANGVSTISATATADANVKSAGLVTVAIPPVVPVTPPAAPTVSIQQVVDNAGNIVDLANVFGQINVALNVDVPVGNTVSKVEVLVDGTTACSQSFTTGSAQVGVEAANAVTIICSINTAKLNGAVPQYANGSHQITARLVGSSGNVLASTTQTFVFNNISILAVAVSGSKNATDPNGLLWQDGVVTIVVTPTIFTTAQLSTITVAMENGPSKTVAVTNNAPVTVTFREDTTVASNLGTQGIEDATETVSATAVTTAGDNFQNGTTYFPTTTFRYDNKGPVFSVNPNLTTLAPLGFMNAGASLTVAKLNATVADGGVDTNTSVIQVANAGSTTWTTVASITDIGEQAAGAKIMRIQTCDKLLNCTNSAATAAFGVDLTAPPITSVTADTINPAGAAVTINMGLDNLSGFDPAGAVWVTIVKDSANASGADVAKCVNPATGALSTVPSTGCVAAQQTATSVTVPAAAGFGYYTITVFAQDLAGNKTASTTKVALVDLTAPTVTITSRGLTNNIPSVAATIADNVELKNYQPFGVFAGAITGVVTNLPMSAPVAVGTFGLPLNALVNASNTLPFGSVETGLGTGVINQINAVGYTAADIASNSSGLIVQPQIGAGVAVTPTNIASFALTSATSPLCQTGTTAACGATTATSSALSAIVTFNPATTTANPIVAVYFYAANGSNAVLLGSATTASFGVNLANQRVFTFSGTATAAALPLLGANTVFAIGVDASGNGVLMGTAAITTL